LSKERRREGKGGGEGKGRERRGFMMLHWWIYGITYLSKHKE
jgi:hypothetical protein